MNYSETTAKPFLKWLGGKTKLLPKILPRLPEKIDRYFEPFLGGGAVFFALAAEGRLEKAVLGDANEELISVFYMLRYEAKYVIRELEMHAVCHRSDPNGFYYLIRSRDPKRMNGRQRAARFIYLNRTCFNGLYRVNRKGGFNVPIGRYKNPTICDEENLYAVADALKSARVVASRLITGDFEKTLRTAQSGDAVYFDPPYVPLSGTSDFTAFTKGGFDEAEHVRLRDCFKALDAQGVHVLLSNSDTPLVRRLYKGFRISKVKAPRRVNSKGDKRGDVSELLILGRSAG